MADNATTSFADRALADAPTDYAQLREWVAQIAELTQPDSVQWVDGSEEERDRLADRHPRRRRRRGAAPGSA